MLHFSQRLQLTMEDKLKCASRLNEIYETQNYVYEQYMTKLYQIRDTIKSYKEHGDISALDTIYEIDGILNRPPYTLI